MAESNSNPTPAPSSSSSGDAAALADSALAPAPPMASSSTPSLSLSHDVFSVKLSSSWTSAYMGDEDGDGDSLEGDSNHSGRRGSSRAARFKSRGAAPGAGANRRTARSRSPLNSENRPPANRGGANGSSSSSKSSHRRPQHPQPSLSARKKKASSSLKPRFPAKDGDNTLPVSRSARKGGRSRSPRAAATGAARSPSSKDADADMSDGKQTHKRPREDAAATNAVGADATGGKADRDTASFSASSSSTPMVIPKKGGADGRKGGAPPPIELPPADEGGDMGDDEFATPMRSPMARAAAGSDATPIAGSSTPMEMLTERRVAQRQKQIDLGKATTGYKNYMARVPRESRRGDKRNSAHPVTPDVHLNCSKRKFDGLVSRWRRRLHLYDVDVDDTEFERRVAAEEALHTPRKTPSVHATPVGKRRKKGDHSPAVPPQPAAAEASARPAEPAALADTSTEPFTSARLATQEKQTLPTGGKAYADAFPVCGPKAVAVGNNVSSSVGASTTGGGGTASFYEALTKQPAAIAPSDDARSTTAMSDVNDGAADSATACRQLNYDSAVSEFGGSVADAMSVASSSAFSSSAGTGTGGTFPFLDAASSGGTGAGGLASTGGGFDAPRTMVVSNNDSVMSSFELNLSDKEDDDVGTEAEAARKSKTSITSAAPRQHKRQPSFAEVLGGLSSSAATTSAPLRPTPLATADVGKAKKMPLAQSGNTPPPPAASKSTTPVRKQSYVSALSATK